MSSSADALTRRSAATECPNARELFRRFPSGVVAIGADVDGEPTVMVASSFAVGVSYEPPMVSFSAQNSSETWRRIRAARRIGISVLAEHQGGLGRQLASKSNRAARLQGVGFHVHAHDALTLHGAMATMQVQIVREVPAGDHTLVLLQVLASQLAEHRPTVYHRGAFQSLAD